MTDAMQQQIHYDYEEKLKAVMADHQIDGEHLSFTTTCHSVAEAAAAANASIDDFVKNICMICEDSQLLVAIVHGADRASTSRVAKALGIPRPRLATAEEIFERTGYPCGGTPSFGFAATFLIDPKVLEHETVYSGGGSEHSLVKIESAELARANTAQVARLRK